MVGGENPCALDEIGKAAVPVSWQLRSHSQIGLMLSAQGLEEDTVQRQNVRISDVRRSQRLDGVTLPLIFNYITRPTAWPFTVAFARLGFGPNGATAFRILVTLLAFAAFLVPNPISFWVGCGLFYFALVLDHVDGQLARLQDRASYFGKFFDGLIDSLAEVPFPFILGMAVWQQGAGPNILVVAAVGALAIALSQILFLRVGLTRKDTDQANARDAIATPVPHPVLSRRMDRWSGILSVIDNTIPALAWDVRYGGFAIALLSDGIEAYLYIYAAWHLLQLVLLLPSRIFRMYAETDIHRRSGSAS